MRFHIIFIAAVLCASCVAPPTAIAAPVHGRHQARFGAGARLRPRQQRGRCSAPRCGGCPAPAAWRSGSPCSSASPASSFRRVRAPGLDRWKRSRAGRSPLCPPPAGARPERRLRLPRAGRLPLARAERRRGPPPPPELADLLAVRAAAQPEGAGIESAPEGQPGPATRSASRTPAKADSAETALRLGVDGRRRASPRCPRSRRVRAPRSSVTACLMHRPRSRHRRSRPGGPGVERGRQLPADGLSLTYRAGTGAADTMKQVSASAELRKRAREAPARPLATLPSAGQAVLEGVMMRGVSTWAVAVRKPTEEQLADGGPNSKEGAKGEIEVISEPLVAWSQRSKLLRLPVVRGVVALGESLKIGFRALGISANAQVPPDDEGEKQEIGGGTWVGHDRVRAAVRDRPLLPAARRADQPLPGLDPQLARLRGDREAGADRDLPGLPVPDLAAARPPARVRVPRRRAQDHLVLRGRPARSRPRTRASTRASILAAARASCSS